MAVVYEGELMGKAKRIGIVVSRFNEAVTKALLEGALNHLRRSGVSETDIEVAWVPGAFEIPSGLNELVSLGSQGERGKFDALLALGCIIRGETTHYEHIAQATTDGIAQVMLTHRVPVGFGLLTVETFDQAMARSGGKSGNKGRDAAQAALEMANLLSQLRKQEFPEESIEALSRSAKEWKRE